MQPWSYAVTDPKLPGLSTALDGHALAERLSEYLEAEQCPWGVERCCPEQVYHRPGKRCEILYRVTLSNSSGVTRDEWFYGRMYPPDSVSERFERLPPDKKTHYAQSLADPLAPVTLLANPGMILWTFPEDRKLPYLRQVVDPDCVRSWIEANPQVFGAAPVVTCREVSCERVKYFPRKRCVLRFHATLSGSKGEDQDVTFYTKTHRSTLDPHHIDVLKAVHEEMRRRPGAFQVPRPLLYLDSVHTIWQEDWEGAALLDVIDDLDWNDLFPRLATALAIFHRSAVRPLERGPNLDRVLAKAAKDGGKLVRMFPRYGTRITTLVERLHACKPDLEDRGLPMTLIHGTLRIQQMLIRGSHLALVDLDRVALGDPLLDVAEFIGSLEWLELENGFPADRVAKATETFLQNYKRQVPWPLSRRRLAWYAVAFLVTRIYRAAIHVDEPVLRKLHESGWRVVSKWLNAMESRNTNPCESAMQTQTDKTRLHIP